jgi:hypothetical protein
VQFLTCDSGILQAPHAPSALEFQWTLSVETERLRYLPEVTMRRIYWFLLFSLALFLGGVASAQARRWNFRRYEGGCPCQLPGAPAMNTPATDTTGPAAMAPKGYVKDLMNYMVMPSAAGVWNAVATSTDQTGVHESRPQTDDEWNKGHCGGNRARGGHEFVDGAGTQALRRRRDSGGVSD